MWQLGADPLSITAAGTARRQLPTSAHILQSATVAAAVLRYIPPHSLRVGVLFKQLSAEA